MLVGFKARFHHWNRTWNTYELQKQYPDRNFYLVSEHLTCYSMKETTLTELYNCLLNDTNEVFVDEDVQKKAIKALDKMLELS